MLLQQQNALDDRTYTGCAPKRDVFIDGCRGLFHIMMMVDHLPLFLPGVFGFLSAVFELFGYVTVMEGFVFLSGFMSGLVYTRTRDEVGDWGMWRRAFRRSASLTGVYFISVGLFLVLARNSHAEGFGWGSWSALLEMPFSTACLRIVTLTYQPRFVDVLPMYCTFFLITPVLIRQYDNRRFVTVIIASAAMWTAAQLKVRPIIVPWWLQLADMKTGYFNSFGWQILFVLGVGCGWRTYRSPGWLPSFRKAVPIAYALAFGLFCVEHDLIRVVVPVQLTEMSSLGVLRIINFISLALLACFARNQIATILSWRGFALLSRHSLLVFSFHAFPILAVAILLNNAPDTPPFARACAGGFCIAFLFVTAAIAELFRRRGKSRALLGQTL